MAASCAPAASAVVGVGDAACFSDHHFRISSVAGYSGYHRILTIHDISTSAQFAHAVLAAEEADTDPLTDFPFGHSAAQGFNPANYFMPRNAWKNQTRVRAHNRWPHRCDRLRMLPPESEPDPLQAQEWVVPADEDGPASKLPSLCMCASSYVPQSFSLSIHSRIYGAQFSSVTPSASLRARNRTTSRSTRLTSFRSTVMSQ